MKLCADGETVEGRLTTDHAASSHGIPVLVIGGTAYGTADTAGFELADATAEERDALQRAGYHIQEAAEDAPAVTCIIGRTEEGREIRYHSGTGAVSVQPPGDNYWIEGRDLKELLDRAGYVVDPVPWGAAPIGPLYVRRART